MYYCHLVMRPRILGWAAGGALAAVIIAALGWGLVTATAKAHTLVGESAPATTIAALDGSTISLRGLRGTPLIVNFWASWCVACREEAPVLNAAARKYAGKIQFLGVDIKDNDAAARHYQAQIRSPYPVGPLIEGSYAQWGVTAPPETYFIDRQGGVISRIIGPVDAPRLEVFISQLGP